MVRDFQVQLKPEAFLAFGDRVAPGQSGRLDLKVRPGIDDFEYPYGIGDPLDRGFRFLNAVEPVLNQGVGLVGDQDRVFLPSDSRRLARFT